MRGQTQSRLGPQRPGAQLLKRNECAYPRRPRYSRAKRSGNLHISQLLLECNFNLLQNTTFDRQRWVWYGWENEREPFSGH
jgi:hypothetical protein